MPDRKPKPQAQSSAERSTKLCVTCGRTITWRKRWERDWEHVRFCSDTCRSHKPTGRDKQLETAILDLLRDRARDKTICPSEAARAVAALGAPPGEEPARELWEPLMEPARAAARRLVAAGLIQVTQKGAVVDPSTAKGAIRLRSVQR